ncbi:MAG: hypothetical protein ACK4JB_22185 [Reyranella sp.]
MALLVQLELPAPAPERGFDLTSTGHFNKTDKIRPFRHGALYQQPVALPRGLYSEAAGEFEMAAGTHHQVRSKSEPCTVEGVVVTPPSGKAGHQFAFEKIGVPGRTG